MRKRAIRSSAIRWAANNGEPFCPHCGCLTVYTLGETPPRWKCSGCRRKFSLTSRNAVPLPQAAGPRLPRGDRAVRATASKARRAAAWAAIMNINPKSSFVLLHKLREAMGSGSIIADEPGIESAKVEVDGAYFGWRTSSLRTGRLIAKDRRTRRGQTGKRQVVVVAREARAWPHDAIGCAAGERCGPADPADTSQAAQIIHADEVERLGAFARLLCRAARQSLGRVQEPRTAAELNQAESYFSRLRRCRDSASIIGSAAICCINMPTKRLARGQPPQRRTARNGIRIIWRCAYASQEPGLGRLLAPERSMTASGSRSCWPDRKAPRTRRHH